MKSIVTTIILCTLVLSLSAQKRIVPAVQKDAPTRTKAPLVDGDYKMKINKKVRSYSYQTGGQKRTLKKEPQNFQVISRNERGIPQWFTGDIAKTKSHDQASNISTWIDETSEMLQVDSKATCFVEKDKWSDKLGQTHIKYDQYHKGVKVFDGQMILHVEDELVFMQNGQVVPSDLLHSSKSITITEEEARTIIKNDLPGFKNNWNPLASKGIGTNAKQWEGEQVYYNHNGTYSLAYNYVVFANMAERYEYIIDAHSGEVLSHWSKICNIHGHDHSKGTCNHEPAKNSVVADGPTTASARDLLNVTRTINTYEFNNSFFMLDGSRDMFRSDVSNLPDEPVGAIWTIDIGGQSPVNGNASYSQIFSNNNSWGNSPEGVSAHYNAGKAYDYFKNVHGRNSITGDGQTIVSIVNVTDEDGSSLGNAFYNSLAIWYGNGDNTFFPLGRALDVAGHELSHGVVENTANLIYQNESGAMNESFADIFGAMIDRDDWLIGEDVVRPGNFPGGALRSISDPHNGAQTGDFGRGWQPRHMNERYTGSEDNGGVHLNSGIPNYAFYLFAEQVGKNRAELVFYRALSAYLTRSSGFKELRYAVEQAANDLYGQNVVNAASQAFADVGIGGGAPTNFEQDVEPNMGANLLLSSTLVDGESILDAIYVDNLDAGEIVFNPLSGTNHQSKPSITDDGARVTFVGTDNHIYFIDIDWTTNPPSASERQVSNEAIWRNAVISKDGNRIALLEVLRNDGTDNVVTVIDFLSDSVEEFELKNPSYTQGVETDNVNYADAMEFDISGNILMYDALNELKSTNGNGDIQYWNIGFLEVWNQGSNTWAEGKIDIPLRLEPNENVGNPTYSKNSPYIIAFDVLTDQTLGTKYEVYGMNTESNQINAIFENETWSYPNYSVNDDFMVFNYVDGNTLGLGIADLNNNKISSVAGSVRSLADEIIFGTWFTTGTRVLSDTEELIEAETVLNLSPVPTGDQLLIELESETLKGQVSLEVMNTNGSVVLSKKLTASDLQSYSLDTSQIPGGTFILSLRSSNKLITKKFLKL